MRHEFALDDDTDADRMGGDTADQDLDKSGRRESNPRSQLGKNVRTHSANVGDQERQVNDGANEGERPQTDTDAP